jgi:hypothetical protein
MHPARKISSAETAVRLRPADADDSKPGGTHVIEHLADGLAYHMQFAATPRAGGTSSAQPQVI